MLIRPFFLLSNEDYQRIFPQSVRHDGMYQLDVTLSSAGDVVSVLNPQKIKSDPETKIAGLNPIVGLDGCLSCSAVLMVFSDPEIPAVIRIFPNVIDLPDGDYIHNLGHLKKTVYDVRDDSPIDDMYLSLLRVSDDGMLITHVIDNLPYSEENRLSHEMMAKTSKVNAVSAIVKRGKAMPLFFPISISIPALA